MWKETAIIVNFSLKNNAIFAYDIFQRHIRRRISTG